MPVLIYLFMNALSTLVRMLVKVDSNLNIKHKSNNHTFSYTLNKHKKTKTPKEIWNRKTHNTKEWIDVCKCTIMHKVLWPVCTVGTENKVTLATHNSGKQFSTIFNLQSKFQGPVCRSTGPGQAHLVYEHSLTDCSHLFPISFHFCLFYKQPVTITFVGNL